jgi:hypothetical protein
VLAHEIFAPNDCACRSWELSTSHPSQVCLAEFSRRMPPSTRWPGDVSVFAQGDIGRFTLFNGESVWIRHASFLITGSIGAVLLIPPLGSSPRGRWGSMGGTGYGLHPWWVGLQ